MTLTAWRVVPAYYAAPPFNPFDGEGARLSGGRWNSPGVPVVYTSAGVSLAVLEVLVHADGLASIAGHSLFAVDIPTDLVAVLDPDSPDLPVGWQSPFAPDGLQRIGDDWVRRAGTPVLRVPSAVVGTEFNYVLNPRHPLFGRLAIGPRQPLPIDPRLLKQQPR